MKRVVAKHPYRVLLSSALVGAALLLAYATVGAQDAPAPDGVTVGFTVSSTTVNEGAGTLNVQVSLTGTSANTVTVQYATVDGTAVAPADYTATSGTLTFPPGTTSQNISITIIDDTIAENPETAYIILSNPQNAILRNNFFIFTINDNDGGSPATVSFEFASWTYNETDATATITVLLMGTPSANVSVDFATSDGTATAGLDYTAVSGTLTWLASEAGKTKSFTISILDDTLIEGTESVNLTLSNPVNATLGSTMLGASSTAVLFIIDDESPCPPPPS